MARKKFIMAPFMDGFGVFLVDDADQLALYFLADCAEDSEAESLAVVTALTNLYS